MNYKEATTLVQYVVDDSLNGRRLNEDQYAIIRTTENFRYRSNIVLICCDDELIGVSVHSYLDCELDEKKSIELAIDYLQEIGYTCKNHMFWN